MLKRVGGFHENAGIKVAAALRRGGSPVQIDRRSEIGSHATPMTAIFIRGGELGKVMGHSGEASAFFMECAGRAWDCGPALATAVQDTTPSWTYATRP
ncbi:MAG TPA: hypothetical protein VMW38_07460 [Terriglobia bacterium]|nr:hypothetical protein [Terriglobia bacterium]